MRISYFEDSLTLDCR